MTLKNIAILLAILVLGYLLYRAYKKRSEKRSKVNPHLEPIIKEKTKKNLALRGPEDQQISDAELAFWKDLGMRTCGKEWNNGAPQYRSRQFVTDSDPTKDISRVPETDSIRYAGVLPLLLIIQSKKLSESEKSGYIAVLALLNMPQEAGTYDAETKTITIAPDSQVLNEQSRLVFGFKQVMTLEEFQEALYKYITFAFTTDVDKCVDMLSKAGSQDPRFTIDVAKRNCQKNYEDLAPAMKLTVCDYIVDA